MITKDNFKEVLTKLGFADSGDSFTKEFKELDVLLKVDFKKEQLSSHLMEAQMIGFQGVLVVVFLLPEITSEVLVQGLQSLMIKLVLEQIVHLTNSQ